MALGVASCWVESVVVGVAALENLSANSSKWVIRRFSSASGERDLAQGRCSEVTWRSMGNYYYNEVCIHMT